MQKIKDQWPLVMFLVFSSVGYYLLGYQISRFESFPLLLVYSALFVAFLFFNLRLAHHFWWGVASFIIFRLVLIVSFPTLSTDVYRFLWDGSLLANGINPYVYTPEEAISLHGFLNGDLYNQLSYKIYHSMYPPFTQISGWMAVALGKDSLYWGAIILRTWVLAGEIFTFYVMVKLLRQYQMDRKAIFWFALNPLVIMELTGNLHHEIYLICFALLAIYLLEKNHMGLSALAMGLGVLSKLLPVIFLPLLVRRLGMKSFVLYGTIVLVVVLVGFAPFYAEELVNGFRSSGLLYFQKLEFNASIYFLVREVGFWVKGYNIIHTAGPWLAVITTLGILLYAFSYRKEVKLAQLCMWVWLIYIALTTTLHPWYVLPLVAFCVFTPFRFGIVWSYFVFLSYVGYTETGYEETPLIFIIEYVVVFGYLIWELKSRVTFRLYERQL